MRFFKKIMGWALKALGGFVVLFIGVVAFVSFASRDEKALVRQFLSQLNAQNFSQAHAMFAPEAQKEVSLSALEQQFGRIALFEKINFSHTTISTEQTTLNALASTADGCQSRFSFVFVDELIYNVKFVNLCQLNEFDA